VGSLTPRQIDVRLVAATHTELTGAVRRGEFREDLYYRLNVVTLTLPSLRQRVEDIELLAEAFIGRIAGAYGLPVPALTPPVRDALRTRSWPGNVRELRNAIERALVLSPRGTLRVEELQSAAPVSVAPAGTLPFPAEMRAIVAAAAQEMLALTGGNKTEAARRLGISRPRLNRILEGSGGEED
jgi:two-component system response regulator HydG